MSTIVLTRKDGSADIVEFHKLQGFTSDELREQCEATYLGRGVSRAAYALSSSAVLKVALSEEHNYYNEAEVELLNNLSEEEYESGLFAKIFAYAHDYSWIIMERIANVGFRYDVVLTEEQTDIVEYYGVDKDLHYDNMGIRENGQAVIIDYAENKYLCEPSVWCECEDEQCKQCYFILAN